MPRITSIREQKRRAGRRNVFLDGRFAFGCSENVVARFRLREGLELTGEQVEAIKAGEVRQECLDRAIDHLTRRLHSRAELKKKLMRLEYGEELIDAVLDELMRLGYVDDERFAKARAASAAQHRHHGPQRVLADLLRAGVPGGIARAAVQGTFGAGDALAQARQLAMKQAPRLRKLDPAIARRRLTGMLQRRGFGYDTIRVLIDEVLGGESEDSDDFAR